MLGIHLIKMTYHSSQQWFQAWEKVLQVFHHYNFSYYPVKKNWHEMRKWDMFLSMTNSIKSRKVTEYFDVALISNRGLVSWVRFSKPTINSGKQQRNWILNMYIFAWFIKRNKTYEAKEGLVVVVLMRLSIGLSLSWSESSKNLLAAIFLKNLGPSCEGCWCKIALSYEKISTFYTMVWSIINNCFIK